MVVLVAAVTQFVRAPDDEQDTDRERQHRLEQRCLDRLQRQPARRVVAGSVRVRIAVARVLRENPVLVVDQLEAGNDQQNDADKNQQNADALAVAFVVAASGQVVISRPRRGSGACRFDERNGGHFFFSSLLSLTTAINRRKNLLVTHYLCSQRQQVRMSALYQWCANATARRASHARGAQCAALHHCHYWPLAPSAEPSRQHAVETHIR